MHFISHSDTCPQVSMKGITVTKATDLKKVLWVKWVKPKRDCVLYECISRLQLSLHSGILKQASYFPVWME